MICFDGGNVRQTVVQMQEKAPVFTVPEPERFAKLCEKLLDDAYPAMRVNLFSLLLTTLLDHIIQESDIADRFHKSVQQQILDNPTVSAVATGLGISREHLQREYFRQTGSTPVAIGSRVPV